MKLSSIAIGFGALALLTALAHFWAGPMAPQPTFETSLGEAVVDIKDAAMRKMRGEDPPPPASRSWDVDDMAAMGISMAGGLAVILAFIGYSRHEPKRSVIAGLALGSGAIAFQFMGWFAMTIFGLILIYALIQNFGNFFDGFFN